ncbi:hypothetical protein RHECNPAF_850048 [Rhizobium etli CNPAF512]|nr:hypothetical protein RHECNPAF_850048 [Rhizobium etli CNPAF512]
MFRREPERERSAAPEEPLRGRRGMPGAGCLASRPAARAGPCPCGDRKRLRSPGPGVPYPSCSGLGLDGFLQRLDEVGALPGERAVAAGLAAEMAVGRGLGVDRLVEVEVTADARRRQIHVLADRRFDLVFGHALAGAVQVDIDRQRLRDADRVGELDRAAVGKAGGHDVLGEVAGGIGGRTVDLGRVLAGECAAAMRSRTAVSVDDDLAAGEAGVAIRAADDELAGRVDVPLAIIGNLQLAERFADIGLDDGADLVGIPAVVEMLGRKYDRGRFRRLAVDVTHRHLALGVRAELGDFAITLLAGGCEQLQDLVGIIDRRRHQVRRFLAGITEHDALVAGALVALLIGGAIDALGDVGRLRVQEHVDLCLFPVEAVLLVADILDRTAGSGLELRRVDDVVAVLVLLHQARRQADLAGNDDAVGRRQRLAGNAHAPRIDAGLGRFAVDQVDDLVGDAVTHFVRVTFGNRFAGKEIIRAHSGIPLKE